LEKNNEKPIAWSIILGSEWPDMEYRSYYCKNGSESRRCSHRPATGGKEAEIIPRPKTAQSRPFSLTVARSTLVKKRNSNLQYFVRAIDGAINAIASTGRPDERTVPEAGGVQISFSTYANL